MKGRESLLAALRWLRAEWPIRFCRHGWRWGWLGNGWNALQLGKVNIWFASGPSPVARIKAQETFLVRFWTAFVPLIALALLIWWLA